MSKTREKKVIMTEKVTKEEAEHTFAEYASADARIKKIEADMDIQFTKIREKHQEKLAELGKIKEDAFAKLQHFAQNAPEYFTKKKSIEFTHGILGFRTSTPSLKTIKGFTWAAVTNMLKSFLPDYVRTIEEPNKEKLLADRDEENVRQHFPKLGIQVVQPETFYVEPKKEEATVSV